MKRVLFILANYPCLTETFIHREIDALRHHGVSPVIFALRNKETGFDFPPIQETLLYRMDIPTTQAIKAFFQLLFRNIGGLCRVLLYVFSYMSHPFYCLKLMRNCMSIFYLSVWIKHSQIGMIHAHFADMPTDIAFCIGLLTNIPFSFSAHARDIFVSPFKLRSKCNKTKAIFACSRYVTEMLETKTGMSNIYTMYHGLDLSKHYWSEIYKTRIQNFTHNYYHSKEVKLLAVGRLVRKKGFHILVEALSLLKTQNVRFCCYIIGEGEEERNLQKQINDLRLEQYIKLFKFMPFNLLIKEFLNSHLFIQPSMIDQNGDRDNIPNVILESQALGVPVLASDLPPIREVIEHEKTGFLTPPGEAEFLSRSLKQAIAYPHMRTVVMNAKEQILDRYDSAKNIKRMIYVWKDSGQL